MSRQSLRSSSITSTRVFPPVECESGIAFSSAARRGSPAVLPLLYNFPAHSTHGLNRLKGCWMRNEHSNEQTMKAQKNMKRQKTKLLFSLALGASALSGMGQAPQQDDGDGPPRRPPPPPIVAGAGCESRRYHFGG